MSLDSEIVGGGAIRGQIVRDRPIGNEAIFLQELSHQCQRGMLVPLGLDQHIEDFALGVDGASVCSEHRPEMVRPAPNCLIRDRNAALRRRTNAPMA
jgi:hypothetical protein